MRKNENGKLSIESNNIFAILKKWLYTEPDIVFRELISNATDAIEKRSLLAQEKGGTSPRGLIKVILDTDNKQLIIRDNGIGMSYDEVHKYINQIAFSGAEDFIRQNNESGKDSIIGHFGVGFYSAFMLADHVAIETKSYQEEAPAVRWDCNADMSYRMSDCEKTEIGTDIILYLNENNPCLAKPALAYDSIKKYFIFSRYDVFFNSPEHDSVLVNDTHALWRKAEDSIAKEDMNAFYKEFFSDTSDPVFWIQFASIDIGIRGIMFFRNTKNGTEELDGQFKVYNRGIYVGQNIPELIPKFINLQSGILECDNLPLVVSRSNIQSDDSNDMLKLVYECLEQEVAIALHNLFQNQRKTYESYWPELNAFVKYGVLQDKTFASVMTKKVIFEDIYGKFQTIEEYLSNEEALPDNTIYYASDKLDQAHYIEIFRKCGINALLFDHVIDQPFLYKYEALKPDYQFVRIDSNIEAVYKGSEETGDDEKIADLTAKITAALGERLGTTSLNFTRLDDRTISALIVNDEYSRRMADMLEIYGYRNPSEPAAAKQQAQKVLLLNLNNPMVELACTAADSTKVNMVLNQLFDLALLSQQALQPENLEAFICRSEQILQAGFFPS